VRASAVTDALAREGIRRSARSLRSAYSAELGAPGGANAAPADGMLGALVDKAKLASGMKGNPLRLTGRADRDRRTRIVNAPARVRRNRPRTASECALRLH
jgi:hypothetical protein